MSLEQGIDEDAIRDSAGTLYNAASDTVRYSPLPSVVTFIGNSDTNVVT